MDGSPREKFAEGFLFRLICFLRITIIQSVSHSFFRSLIGFFERLFQRDFYTRIFYIVLKRTKTWLHSILLKQSGAVLLFNHDDFLFNQCSSSIFIWSSDIRIFSIIIKVAIVTLFSDWIGGESPDLEFSKLFKRLDWFFWIQTSFRLFSHANNKLLSSYFHQKSTL